MADDGERGTVVRMVVFSIDDQRYAVPLESVIRIVHAVEVTPLPGAPALVHGAFDLAGQVTPALNLRRRLGRPERPIVPADRFVVVRAGGRVLALVADAEHEVMESAAAAIVEPGRIYPGLEGLQGVVQREDGLILVHDLEKFLSLEEAAALEAAMRAGEARP